MTVHPSFVTREPDSHIEPSSPTARVSQRESDVDRAGQLQTRVYNDYLQWFT